MKPQQAQENSRYISEEFANNVSQAQQFAGLASRRESTTARVGLCVCVCDGADRFLEKKANDLKSSVGE